MRRRTVLISFIVIAAVLLAALAVWRLDLRNDYDLELSSFGTASNTGKQVTLTIILPGLIRSRVMSAEWDEVMNEFEKQAGRQLHIMLKFKRDNGMYAVLRKLEQGEDFDMLACVEDPTFGDFFGTLAQKNIAADISSLFTKYAPGYYSSLSNEELKGVTVDGRIFGVPARYPSSRRAYALVRDDLLNKYDKPEIKDLDDLEAFLQRIKEGEQEIIPVYFASNMLDLFAVMHGYEILDRELGVVYRWEDSAMRLMPWEQTPEFPAYCERLDSWVRKGYMLKEANFIPPDKTVVSQGRFACIIDSFGSAENYNFAVKQKGVSEWRFTEYVLYPDKVSQMDNPSKACIVFKRGSENVDRSLMLLEWLQSSQENYDLFMYGLKGRHYTLYGEQFTLPGGSGVESVYLNWPGRVAFRNAGFERSSTASPPDSGKLYSEVLLSTAKYTPHLGFFINQMEIGEREYNNLAALNLYDLRQKVQSGKFSGDAITEYINGRKSEGIDRLVDTAQRQLDEWRRNNEE